MRPGCVEGGLSERTAVIGIPLLRDPIAEMDDRLLQYSLCFR